MAIDTREQITVGGKSVLGWPVAICSWSVDAVDSIPTLALKIHHSPNPTKSADLYEAVTGFPYSKFALVRVDKTGDK